MTPSAARLLMLARVQLAELRDMAENQPVETWPRSEQTVRALIYELEQFTGEFVEMHVSPEDYTSLSWGSIGNNLRSASSYATILLRDLKVRRYLRHHSRLPLTPGGNQP
jgi:hypothetical protein